MSNIQPNIYQYFLTNVAGEYLSWVNDALVTSANPVVLGFAPIGWMEKEMKFQRNTKYHGLNRTITLPLKYVKDASKILKTIYYTQGYEAIVNLIIKKNNTDDYQYEPYYTGEIDLSVWKDHLENVEVNAVEGGLSKYIKAGENTTIEIPLEVQEAKPLYFDGLAFKDTLNFETLEQPMNGGKYKYVGLTFLNNEGTSIGVTYYSVYGQNSPIEDFTTPDYFLSTTSNLTANFKFKVTFRLTKTCTVKIYFHTQTREFVFLADTSLGAGDHTYSFDQDVSLLADENLYFILKVDGHYPDGVSGIVDVKTESFVVSYDSQAAPTTILCLTSEYVYKYIINKLSDGKCTASSVFLANLKNSVFLTSGDGVRGLTGAVIKTSLIDFFKSHDSVWQLGLGEDTGIAVIEERGTFYIKNNEIVDVGEVKDCVPSCANDYIHNSIKIGYPDQKYDERNGKDEFNTTVEFSAPVKRVPKVLDLVSPYRADMYGIELTRANLDGKKTTDSKSDNDVFFLGVIERVTLNAGVASQMLRTVPLVVSATLNEKRLVLFQSVATSFSTTDFKKYTYLAVTGTVRFTSIDFSITITDVVNPSVKKIQLFKNDIAFATASLDGSGTVTIPAAIIIKPGDILSAGITRNAIGDYSIDAADMSVNFQAYTLYELSRPAGYTITGLINPATAFNYDIFTPKRNLYRHGGWIRSFLEWMDALYIKFQSTLKNGDLKTHRVTIISDETVTERDDELIGSLRDRMFKPHFFTFTAALPYNIIETVKANPYGVIGFHWKGTKYQGFVMEIAHKPGTREEQTIKVLSSPDNDLTTLITVD